MITSSADEKLPVQYWKSLFREREDVVVNRVVRWMKVADSGQLLRFSSAI
jgi:hypothetical protein